MNLTNIYWNPAHRIVWLKYFTKCDNPKQLLNLFIIIIAVDGLLGFSLFIIIIFFCFSYTFSFTFLPFVREIFKDSDHDVRNDGRKSFPGYLRESRGETTDEGRGTAGRILLVVDGDWWDGDGRSEVSPVVLIRAKCFP